MAALGSWLDARQQQGQWLLRHEDLDTPRIVPGADSDIEHCLLRLGLVPDEPPVRQSSRLDAYQAAFRELAGHRLIYPCRCSRSEVGSGPYPGTCRNADADPAGTVAWRLRLPDQALCFVDRIQGRFALPPASLGDPVVRRRDGVFAYQFAVVVDDAWQGITDVVRGADLLESTGWQVAIAAGLRLPIPRFLHLPVVVEADGSKLAKSRRSLTLESLDPLRALALGLSILCPGLAPEGRSVPALLEWGLRNFDPQRLEGLRESRFSKDYLGSSPGL